MPPWLRTLPPCWRELRCRRVFYGSGHHLPTGKGFGAAMHPAVPYRLRASSIKKGLADLPMQLGSRVSKPCVHVPNVPDARAIMGLQDMWIGDVIITCKTCGQGSNNVATVPRRPCWPLMGHYYSARRPDRAVPYRGSCVAWQNDKTGCTPCH
jgi:hypothetical protein